MASPETLFYERGVEPQPFGLYHLTIDVESMLLRSELNRLPTD